MATRAFLGVLLGGLLSTACTSARVSAREPDQLYFKVEVQQGGRRVAAPNLLGFEGRHIVVERGGLDGAPPDYRLVLSPTQESGGYRVGFDLELHGHPRLGGRLGLLHGEERSVQLGDDVELRVLLMRVDSPEFRALMLRNAGKSNSI